VPETTKEVNMGNGNTGCAARRIIRIIGFVLVSGLCAVAGPDDQRDCSNATLSGDYIYAGQGLVSPGPPPPQLTFTGIGTVHFDGRGGLSWFEHTVIAGAPQGAEWTAATGFYVVNATPKCTASATINTPNSPVPLKLHLVLLKSGKEARMVADGHAISTVLIRND
jgi:hypothetical protein